VKLPRALIARAVPHGSRNEGYVLADTFRSRWVTLPYPPSANVYWRNVNGRMLLSREAREFKKTAAARCVGQELLSGDVRVVLYVYRPQRSGDLDNRIKPVLDAVRGYLFHDDKQVVGIHAHRGDDKDNPRVEIAVYPAGGTK
jgi:crossover junction endodeoxyribonuclease RusA